MFVFVDVHAFTLPTGPVLFSIPGAVGFILRCLIHSQPSFFSRASTKSRK